LIYYGIWEHPTLVKEWYIVFDPIMVLFGYSIITILPGEYLSYGIRKLIEKYKKLKG